MSRRGRLILFAVAGPGFAAVLVAGLGGLPSFGHALTLYATIIDRSGVALRHGTDVITALNFDFRAFDTLGEEFILFASVLGIALILRDLRDEPGRPAARAPERHLFSGASGALQVGARVLVPALIALGIYVVVHGQLTPGGGFQGGLILAAAVLAIFVSAGYLRTRRVAPHQLIELGETAGAAGYTLLGITGLILGGTFLENVLPLGTPGMLLSGGQMDVASVLVGLEVAGAFLVAWTEFLDQAMVVPEGAG